MRREWEPEELIACWTLVDADWRLVVNKSGARRLGFAVLLKFFELEGRFPRHAGEPPPAAVDYVAEQVKIDASEFAAGYAFSGRTVEYHRAQIRTALGFREASRADEERLSGWLACARGPRCVPRPRTGRVARADSRYGEVVGSRDWLLRWAAAPRVSGTTTSARCGGDCVRSRSRRRSAALAAAPAPAGARAGEIVVA